jgi:two-component system phosphate regulon response regulator PhoB
MLGEPPYGASAQPGGWTALAKPIVPRVLVTRVLAMLRRQHGGALVADDKPLRAGPIEVGRNVPGARVRTADGWIELMLSPTEHRLLQFLVASPNRTHSREAIALAVWGAGRVAARTVDQAVRRLRRHLAEAGAEALVKTVPRVGYRGHIPTRHRNGS